MMTQAMTHASVVRGRKGQTFVEPSAQDSSQQEPRQSAVRNDMVVAVVDDDESVLALVKSVLSSYRVEQFDRPSQALAALRGGLRPNLIISDVMMPGMTGFEMHEEVRGIPSARSVPFVFLTSMSDRDHIRRGMTQGADDYLTKPFTPADLRDAVRARLERSGALRDSGDDVLVLTSLGGLDVAYGAKRLHWEARMAVELLLLLLDADGAVPLQTVRAELWFGAAAENHLHVLVSRLRKTLADVATVTMENDALLLNFGGKVRWDAVEFESLARSALEHEGVDPVEHAIARYAGDFLAGFDSPWAERRRVELQDLYMELLEAAVERAPGASERQRAERRLEGYLDLDPA